MGVRPRRLGFGALLLALLVVACGKQGPPMPPPRYIPAPTTDLSIHQQGRELILELSYPAVTVGGLPLGGVNAVEVWEMVVAVPESGVRPEIDPRSFAQGASRLLTLQGGELNSATTGEKISARVLLAEPAPEPELHVFSVRTMSTRGEASAFSNLVRLWLEEPIPPPRGLRVEARSDGIALEWESGSPATVAYHVYRRRARERGYGLPLQKVPAESRQFLDIQAVYGTRYIYTVRALASEDPLLESSPAGEQEIDYEDRFAPAPPQNLLALAEGGRVRLVWEASADADTVAYHLYRQDPGGPFRRIDRDPVAGLEHLDEGLVEGLTYRYRATSVDGAGNEGEPCAAVAVTVR